MPESPGRGCTDRVIKTQMEVQKMEQQKIRLGIIGIGNMGSEHCRNIAAGKCPEIEITAGADLRESRRVWFRENMPDSAEIYESGEELIRKSSCDAVLICVPHYGHESLSIAAMENGKHVLCEKPVACNLDQLNKMIEKAKEKKLFFMEAMWTAFNPCIKKVKKIIEEGKIGEIKHIESSFYNRFEKDLKNRFWNPELAGGGLLDLGIYCIYYALCINNFEKLVDHSSSARLENGVDAWNSVNLKFKNGVTSHFQTAMDISSTTNSHDAVIYGTKGFITSTNFLRQTKAEIYLYKNEKGGEFELAEEINAPFDVNGFEYQLINATECINKGLIESDVHSFQRSIELCEIMDMLRKDWGMKYPFEK